MYLYLCDCEFNQEDPDNPGYSMTEYDLYAELNMTIRKNLTKNVYEIVGITNSEIKYTGNLHEVVKIANELEGEENTIVKCKHRGNKND